MISTDQSSGFTRTRDALVDRAIASYRRRRQAIEAAARHDSTPEEVLNETIED